MVSRMVFVIVALLSITAEAWMDAWQPSLNAKPAPVKKLPAKSISGFVGRVWPDGAEFRCEYSEGGAVDLNGDGITDYVFVIPWMGCGLNASGTTAYFVVSDGAKGRILNTIEGYGSSLEDVVDVDGKRYFRHSAFFNEFEESKHNHWVYQMFSFGTNGVARCANADFGGRFPAVTIFYENPKFKQIQLKPSDHEQIAKETKIQSKKYDP